MSLNEADTRAKYIDPALKESGWEFDGTSVVSREVRVRREFSITEGRILGGGKRGKLKIADYVLEYKGLRLAVVEAKKFDLNYTDGSAQAIEYAKKLQIPYAYSTNGQKIRQINMITGEEKDVEKYPRPEELLASLKEPENEWRDEFRSVPFENKGQTVRYFAQLAVEKTLDSIALGDKRILLTLATGTGKTRIAFHIAWKLFQTRWTITGEKKRRPRILFLADRNILANQAYNEFSAFTEDERIRISPKSIAKRKSVPTNANIFFTIFQTFMTGPEGKPNFGEYPQDFFDVIIVDECHRGGANDESNWRDILEYFASAVQIGLTATPKRRDNVDTYKYFGDPKFVYKLKDGIEDGFLTPFRVRKYTTNIDEYVYDPEDDVLEGDIEAGEEYTDGDWNTKIEIRQREEYLVDLFMKNIGTNEKTIVFCANQNHAALIRDIINEKKQNANPTYCVRVTANDGELGEDYLRAFQDNEKTIPTILTTSQKLSTGVDARNIRHIVILRPVKSIIEFKQIIGRGTRLYDGKDYFTIHDFFNASHNFYDPEWDGDPDIPVDGGIIDGPTVGPTGPGGGGGGTSRPEKIVVRLSNGKELAFQNMTEKMFYSVDGKTMTLAEFIQSLFNTLDMPEFFKNEEELRAIWSVPTTRKQLLHNLENAGFPQKQLEDIQDLIDARSSDLFDVLEYVKYHLAPVMREARAVISRSIMETELTAKQMEFVDFLVQQYVVAGVDELDDSKLETLLSIKYKTATDGVAILGSVDIARNIFLTFQKHLYKPHKTYAVAGN
ncbi:MAG: DEAD/DEAH box helicase family protein [Actinobacteria bacterium]|nr:DEAD/DEAH box helicase family protein [Actinomycetota bacterium]